MTQPTDTISTQKILQPSDEVVASLIRLRDELWSKRLTATQAEDTIAMKINSCLYGRYPTS